MDLEQRLRASLVAPDPGPTFTARVMARLGGGAARRRSSLILLGTVLVVGAAAAMLAWQMSAVQAPSALSAVIPAVSDPASVAGDPVAQSLPEVKESIAPVSSPEPMHRGVAQHYSVVVMPLRQEAQNVAGRGPVEAFYAAMLDELRKVPGLSLQTPDDSQREIGSQADHVLTITSLATAVSQSRGVAVRSTDGRTTYTYDGGMSMVFTNDGSGGVYGTGAPVSSFDPEGSVFVEVKVESRQAAASRSTLPVGTDGSAQAYDSGAMAGVVNLVLNKRLTGFNLDMDDGRDEAGDGDSPRTWAQPAASPRILPLRADPPDASFQQRCGIPNVVRPPECLTPAQLAANQVEELRLQVFPPDAAFQQRVVARLGNIVLDQSGQMQALQNLLQKLTADGGSRLDAGTLQELVRFAARQPVVPRLYIWRALHQVSHPALVAPLVESLRHDADQQVRLAALSNLEAGFSSNPVVRSAFEKIGQEDRDEVVRVAVRRALYGQGQWRDEIVVALLDTALSYEARLAPLLASGPAVSARQQEQRRAALRDQQVLRPLVSLLREHLRDSDHAKVTSEALSLLGNVDDPAVFDLFMQFMRETPALKQETSMAGNGINLSGPVSSWVYSHRTDPRVLASLSEVDPRLRGMMEQSRVPVSAVPATQVDLTIIPSNLIQRMKEVTEKAASPAPPTQ